LDRVNGEIKSFRSANRLDQRWDTWRRFREGDAWQQPTEPIFMANLVGNFIERKIASLTQAQPDIRVSSRNPLYQTSAEVITKTAQAILAEQSFDARVESAADFAATYGFVGFHTAWDAGADFGDGNIILETLDPRRFAVDHRVKDVTDMSKAQYIRIDTAMPLSHVRAMWPGRGAEVKADPTITNMNVPGRQAGTSWWGSPTKRPIWQAGTVEGPYEWATISEYWLASEQLDETGNPAFPTRRRIVRGGPMVILEDGPNPYWDGQAPIDIWDWRVNHDSFMGRSDVHEVAKLQETINRIGNAITENIILSAAITVIADYNALKPEDWKKLDNRAARILKKFPGREVTFVPPPPIPSQYLHFTQILTGLMETLLGVPPSMQGRRQEGVVSSSAVEGLMTAAETLIRATARRLEYVIERIGMKLISRIIQFYTSDRILLIQGPSQSYQEYTFRRAEMLKPLTMGIDPATQEPLDENAQDEKLRQFFTNFRFKVTPLSSMPQNRIQRGLMALQLFQAGLVDQEEVLKFVEWPDWENVMKRVQQKQATGQLAMPGMGENGGKDIRSGRQGTTLKL
jgi:hypothetical protein